MTEDVAGDEVSGDLTDLQRALLGSQSIEQFLRGTGAPVRPPGDRWRVVRDDATAQRPARDGRLQRRAAAQVDEVHISRRGAMLARHAARGPGAYRRHGRRGDLAPVRVEGGIVRDRLLPGAAADRGRQAGGRAQLLRAVRRRFGADQTRRAEGFAENASGALALALRLSSYAALTDQLRSSLASRTVIDQALGVIMAQERCTHSRAFAILRAASQNRNVKLRDIAAAVVMGVSGEPPQPPEFEDG